jgi:beta-phosphoglucomutase-like phosphatase (HAD superfamily)
MPARTEIDPLAIEALLCDADGCLFPSEEPAFAASAAVTNDFLEALGAKARFGAEELRLATTGKNFRTTAPALAEAEGKHVDPGDLEFWVEAERRRVAAHLGEVLRPDHRVREPLARLAQRRTLALVSSSASGRLDVCVRATDLEPLFPAERRFSAESSLPTPTSKPDPAIYILAGERLGISPPRGLAVEDSVPGAEAAIAAGFPTLGNVMFVPPLERANRIAELQRAGAAGIISSWAELEGLLAPDRVSAAPVPVQTP